ncbi:MAG: FAD-dependent oxidoreductase [Bacteroidota bacterium]
MNFSATHRETFLQRLQSEPFDLLVIGGGITGAGVALDAASRGLKVALVEKEDFAFGTSSRSTKLIHGGLRYLKQLEFGLVKEVGSERAVVHHLAPHLVVPEKMLLPLYEKRGFGSLLTSLGLKLYDWLAGVRPEDQRKMLTRGQTFKAEPLLNPLDINGGALYAEYRTDDARLTIEIIKTAYRKGALPVNYLRVTDLLYKHERVAGARVMDEVGQREILIHASIVVNAAGPWVDELREMNGSKTGKYLHLTKGVHIVVSRQKLPVRQSIYFDVGDGRMIFAIPRDRTTYIGTTDTNYAGSKDQVYATQEDVAYLLKAINTTFAGVDIQSSDIESSWAGLRPLIHEDGKSASELSRKDEIFESPSGLISIAGGKLTGYRKMAERVVNLVAERGFANRKLATPHTHKIRLHDAFFSDDQEVRHFTAMTAFDLKQGGFDESLAEYLVHNYGKQAKEIVEKAATFEEDKGVALIRAEVMFCINKEMANFPVDFLIRRTGMLYFRIERVRQYLDVVLNIFSNAFHWPLPVAARERARVVKEIDSATLFLKL